MDPREHQRISALFSKLSLGEGGGVSFEMPNLYKPLADEPAAPPLWEQATKGLNEGAAPGSSFLEDQSNSPTDPVPPLAALNYDRPEFEAALLPIEPKAPLQPAVIRRPRTSGYGF